MAKPIRPLGPPRPARTPSESALPPDRRVTNRPSAAAAEAEAEAEMYDQMRAAGAVEMREEIRRVPAMPDPEDQKNRKTTVADLRDDRRRALPVAALQVSEPTETPTPPVASHATEPANPAKISPSERSAANDVSPEATPKRSSSAQQKPGLERPTAEPNSAISPHARESSRKDSRNGQRALETQIVRPSRMETKPNEVHLAPAAPTAHREASDAKTPAWRASPDPTLAQKPEPKIHRAYRDISPREVVKSAQPLPGSNWKTRFAGIGRARRARNTARAKAGGRLALAGGFAAAATGIAALVLRNRQQEKLLESLLSIDQKSVRDSLAQQEHVRASLIAEGKPVYISVSFEIHETESFISDQSSMPGVRLVEAKYTSEPPKETSDETTKWMGIYQERRTNLTRGFVLHAPRPAETTEPGPWRRDRVNEPGPLAF